MLNTDLSFDLAIPLLATYPNEIKTSVLTHTQTYTKMFTAALLIIVKE